MNHIVLIGFMGCGKSSVGEKLAEYLDLPFIDTDLLIEEQEKMSVNEIFETFGEAAFRKKETETLQKIAGQKERHVIAVGGGLPVQTQNEEILKEMGDIVYLRADTGELVKRLEGDTSRPMLKGGNLLEKIDSLKKVREPIYVKMASFSIDTVDLPFEKIIEKIVEKLF